LQGPRFNAGDGTLGNQVGQQGFIGAAGNNGRVVGLQNAGQSAGNFQQTNFGNLGGGRGGQMTQQQTITRPIRPQFRVSFPVTPVATPAVEARLAQQISNLNVPGLAGLAVQLDDSGVARLSGIAESEDQRRLMEAFVRLEPGVRSIDNQIQVAPPQ
jgi:hypothetical protein